jgi:oxygen-independent coproporphyrinogen-3 oxidase
MRHVYVHVPFCRRRCVYCDFAIAVRRDVPAQRYVDAIRREYAYRTRREGWDDDPLETLYFGGGTPSLLPVARLAALVRHLVEAQRSGPAAEGIEITLEANPDDVTAATAAGWVAAGFNRVSLGVQAFDGGVLEWMHRTHDRAASVRAVRLLREAGVGSLSLDLIFALPEALPFDFRTQLEQALQLEPEHLSVYGLTVEPRTALARWVSRGATRACSEGRYVEQFLLAHELLTGAGFEHYEVSNYARPGERSRHNGMYWTRRPYLGLGPSAHSFKDGERRWNAEPWAAYERAIARDGDATADSERLTEEQARLEAVYLGLRTSDGISRAELGAGLGRVAEESRRRGWLVEDGGRVRLSPEGWLNLDTLVTA